MTDLNDPASYPFVVEYGNGDVYAARWLPDGWNGAKNLGSCMAIVNQRGGAYGDFLTIPSNPGDAVKQHRAWVSLHQILIVYEGATYAQLTQ